MKEICITLVFDKGYVNKSHETIKEIREIGKYNGDIVCIISDDLKEQIKTSCPWFSWNTIIDGHVRKIKELKEFYEKYNELPKQKGTRENEKILAEWISSCCKNKKNGKLDTELETKIMTECPWFKWIRIPGTYGRTK